jgi:hypothetical protein
VCWLLILLVCAPAVFILCLITQPEKVKAVLTVLNVAIQNSSSTSSTLSGSSSSHGSGTTSGCSSAAGSSAGRTMTALPPIPLSKRSEQGLFGNWQTAGDEQQREVVSQEILDTLALYISSSGKDLHSACREALPNLAQRLEQAIYRTADSHAKYMQAGSGVVLRCTMQQFYNALAAKVDTEPSTTAAATAMDTGTDSDSEASSDDKDCEQWPVYTGTFIGHLVRFSANGEVWYGRIASCKIGFKKPDNQWLIQYRDGHKLRHWVLDEEQKCAAIKAASVGFALLEEGVVARAQAGKAPDSSAEDSDVAAAAAAATASTTAAAAAAAASGADAVAAASTIGLGALGVQESNAGVNDASGEQHSAGDNMFDTDDAGDIQYQTCHSYSAMLPHTRLRVP